MDRPRAKRGRAKDEAPSQLVLDLLLVLFEGPRRSADIADGVSVLGGREVPVATFYRQLQKTVDAGWVADAPDELSGGGPGRPSRRYRITATGELLLREGLERQRRRLDRAVALGLLTATLSKETP